MGEKTEKTYMITAEEVAEELGISKSHAYKILREFNKELETEGYLIISGKIPRAFLEKKIYGYQA